MVAALLTALATASPAAADSSGLVGYWKFDAGQGAVATDSAGFGNSGAIVGNAAWVPGIAGSALNFDGSGQGWVVVPDSSSLEPTPAVTVTAWVKSSGSPGSYRYILAKGATGCIAASYGLYSGLSGGLAFYVSTGHGMVYRDSPDAGTAVWDGRWHFVVGTYDGATVRLYVDGVQVGNGAPWGQPLQYTLSDSNNLFIGDYPGCPQDQYGFRGTIDEVTVWDRALSAAEIAADGASPQRIVPPPATTIQPPASPGASVGAPQTASGRQAAPELKFLNLIPAMFRLRPHSHGSGTTISYVATERDVADLTVLRALPGTLRHRRCARPVAVRSGGHAKRCTRYVEVGAFRHPDHAGNNRFVFNGLAGRPLTPGQYRLEATPYAHGKSGPTIAATFWVLR